MSEVSHPRKNDALSRVRQDVTRCPKCGQAFDKVEANTHQTTPDPATWRLYFLFLHGKKECVDFTTGRDFETWFEKAKAAR